MMYVRRKSLPTRAWRFDARQAPADWPEWVRLAAASQVIVQHPTVPNALQVQDAANAQNLRLDDGYYVLFEEMATGLAAMPGAVSPGRWRVALPEEFHQYYEVIELEPGDPDFEGLPVAPEGEAG